MNPTTKESRLEAQVVVVGGGPAGSTAACALALRGKKVVLLERTRFPRYQIGESLLPSTIHGVCELIGVGAELRSAGFVRKAGGTFRWGKNPEPWAFTFAASPRMAGPTSWAYQVERSKFDAILLDRARSLGVEVHEQCEVRTLEERDGRIAGVSVLDASGKSFEVAAEFVIDASGNTSRTHQRIGGARRYSDFFKNVAVFGYYENAKRFAEPAAGNIFCSAFDEGWIWFIPLSDTLTSVGAVVRHEYAEEIGRSPRDAWHKFLQSDGRIADLLDGAREATTPPYDEVRVRKDYSYIKERFHQPGVVLVGDAACFIDPVFSSGVHLATYSALLAARALNGVLEGDVHEGEAMAEFERQYRDEFARFYEFLVGFYDMHEDESSYFWRARSVTGAPLSDFESFVELVGGVSGSGGDEVRSDSARARLLHAARDLESVVDATSDAESELNPFFRSRTIAHAMESSGRLQVGVATGDFSQDAQKDEPFELTPDGLSWRRR